MTSFIYNLKDNYKDWRVGHSEEVDKLPLMDNPEMVLGILTIYLSFVLRIGPAIMKNREPMQLRKTLVVYNGAQILLSAWIMYQSLRVNIPISAIFSSSCQQSLQLDENIPQIAAVAGWWYFFGKLTELVDTVFFVLRKQTRQISFLHVYHHTNMVFFTWLFLKFAPTQHGAIIGVVNSGVHVFMYTYYMLSALGPEYQKYLWWKKYVTVVQLVQFCIVITYMSVLSISSCGFQRSISYFFIANTFIFLFLFADFYRKAYKKKSDNQGSEKLAQKPILENEILSKSFMSDSEPYSQISKDVVYLNQDIKLRKRE